MTEVTVKRRTAVLPVLLRKIMSARCCAAMAASLTRKSCPAKVMAWGWCVLLALVSAHAAEVTVLNLAHIYPSEHPTAKALSLFSNLISSRSQGRLRVKVYEDAAAGNQSSIFQSLRNGTLDISVLSQGVITTVVPEAAAFGLPFLFSSKEKAWRVLEGASGRRFVRKIADQGLVVLNFWDIEVRHLTNSVRPVRKPADVAGLCIRTPPDPLAIEVFTALDADVRVLNFSDLHEALRLRIIDGQENPVLNVAAMKLYEVQKYLSLIGQKYSVFMFLMTKSALDRLSVIDRVIVEETAQEAARYHRTLVATEEVDAMKTIVAHGIRVDQVDRAAFVDATTKIYDRWLKSGIGDFVRLLISEARSSL